MLYAVVGMMYPAMDPGPQVEELRARLLEELDYRAEARNQQSFAELYAGHPFIRVPRVHAEHSTAHVITSEYVEGRTFARVLEEERDPSARSRWGEIIYRFVFGSIWRHAVFNGDPHPGNYLFDDAGRVVFLDYGCVKYFSRELMGVWKTVVDAHFAGDRPRFRRCLSDLGFFAADAEVDVDLVYDFFGEFYRPWRHDEEFEFTPAYASGSLKLVFQPSGRYAPLRPFVQMPRDFVFVNRIQWGVYSILAQLGARGHFHRIHREYLAGAPPSTELGRLDEEHRRSWRQARGLPDSAVVHLTLEGPRAVPPVEGV
jgi:hypothetical protein